MSGEIIKLHVFLKTFNVKNFPVAPHSTSKFDIFHILKFVVICEKSIPEPLKINSIFQKSILTKGRVSLVLYAESADYKDQFQLIFFSNVNKQKK